MGEYNETAQQSIWNFDGAELFFIFGVKSGVANALKYGDLEEAYRNIRLLRMELDAKLQRTKKKIIEEFEEEIEAQKKIKRKGKTLTEKEEVDNMMVLIDNYYTNNYNDNKDNETIRESFYKLIEEFYMHLSYLMKKHGLYFREGEDMRLAVLRR